MFFSSIHKKVFPSDGVFSTKSINLSFKGSHGLSFSIQTSYKSDYYYSDSHNERSKSYSLTDLLISKEIGKLSTVKIWTRNLFDQRYATRGFYFALIPPDYPDQLWESYGDPIQVGLTYNYNI